MNEKLSCTQVKCSWLMVTAVKEVPYAPVSDMILDRKETNAKFRSNYQRFDNKRKNCKKLEGGESFNSRVRRDRFEQFLY